MGAFHVEEVQFVVVAPAGEDPQIGGVADTGAAGVAGEERCDAPLIEKLFVLPM